MRPKRSQCLGQPQNFCFSFFLLFLFLVRCKTVNWFIDFFLKPWWLQSFSSDYNFEIMTFFPDLPLKWWLVCKGKDQGLQPDAECCSHKGTRAGSAWGQGNQIRTADTWTHWVNVFILGSWVRLFFPSLDPYV